MANRNTAGFGLIAQGTLGSTPATGGQGKYYIQANYATSLFQGTAVNQTAGYIITAQAAITNTCIGCLLYTSPSPRDGLLSRMPSSA